MLHFSAKLSSERELPCPRPCSRDTGGGGTSPQAVEPECSTQGVSPTGSGMVQGAGGGAMALPPEPSQAGKATGIG